MVIIKFNSIRLNKLNGLLATIVIMGSFLWFGKGIWQRTNNIKVIMLPTPQCDLRTGPCSTTLPSGELIELSSLPTNLPALTPVLLQVKTKNINVKSVSVDFKGLEMPMGEFHYNLTPQGPEIYSARTMLPTCKNPEMAWAVNVIVNVGYTKYCAPFVLVNERPTRGWRS
jgi:hypothetical protein